MGFDEDIERYEVELQQLKDELKAHLVMIDEQIEQIERDSASGKLTNWIVEARAVKDMNGNYLLTPLLVAKAQTLAALVTLRG